MRWGEENPCLAAWGTKWHLLTNSNCKLTGAGMRGNLGEGGDCNETFGGWAIDLMDKLDVQSTTKSKKWKSRESLPEMSFLWVIRLQSGTCRCHLILYSPALLPNSHQGIESCSGNLTCAADTVANEDTRQSLWILIVLLPFQRAVTILCIQWLAHLTQDAQQERIPQHAGWSRLNEISCLFSQTFGCLYIMCRVLYSCAVTNS